MPLGGTKATFLLVWLEHKNNHELILDETWTIPRIGLAHPETIIHTPIHCHRVKTLLLQPVGASESKRVRFLLLLDKLSRKAHTLFFNSCLLRHPHAAKLSDSDPFWFPSKLNFVLQPLFCHTRCWVASFVWHWHAYFHFLNFSDPTGSCDFFFFFCQVEGI